jgi:hypothetical protein
MPVDRCKEERWDPPNPYFRYLVRGRWGGLLDVDHVPGHGSVETTQGSASVTDRGESEQGSEGGFKCLAEWIKCEYRMHCGELTKPGQRTAGTPYAPTWTA